MWHHLVYILLVTLEFVVGLNIKPDQLCNPSPQFDIQTFSAELDTLQTRLKTLALALPVNHKSALLVNSKFELFYYDMEKDEIIDENFLKTSCDGFSPYSPYDKNELDQVSKFLKPYTGTFLFKVLLNPDNQSYSSENGQVEIKTQEGDILSEPYFGCFKADGKSKPTAIVCNVDQANYNQIHTLCLDSNLPDSSLANEIELIQENAINILKKIAKFPKDLSFLSDDLQLGSFEKDANTNNLKFLVNETLEETDDKNCLKNLLTFDKLPPAFSIPAFITSALFKKHSNTMTGLIDYGKNFIDIAMQLKSSFADKTTDPLITLPNSDTITEFFQYFNWNYFNNRVFLWAVAFLAFYLIMFCGCFYAIMKLLRRGVAQISQHNINAIRNTCITESSL